MLNTTHPGVKGMLEGGAMSIRRTTKDFSRSAVDLTLEQTINADAASRLTGVARFGHSDSARKRWMITRAARSEIVGLLLEKAGLKSKEDVTKELRPHRVQKDNADIQKVIDGIKKTMNPFVTSTEEPDVNLYCLTTGKQASEDVRDDLLGCVQKGEAWCAEFKDGSFEDGLRFQKPISRRKVKNFASDAVKTKLTCKDQKLLELKGTRDLFGRLLYVSTMEDVDLSKVFCYPLTPVPLSLAHVDGSMNKTDKSKLMHKLEAVDDSTPPSDVDVTLVDAMFMLHIMQNVPPTYGGLGSMILNQLCTMSNTVHFVCDTYVTPSLKTSERDRRGAQDMSFAVTGTDQKRPKDWQHALQSPSFKNAFFRYLAEDWKSSRHADTLRNHDVYLAIDGECHQFTEEEGVVYHELLHQYGCQHEEADTRLIFHLRQTHTEYQASDLQYVVRSNDTDVMILLLYHVSHFQVTPRVWMDAGLSGNNTRRYINITQMLSKMEPVEVDALPGLHAFTGSDFTASFMNKGKQKPLDIMRKDVRYTEAFSHMGEDNILDGEYIPTIESFVCALYGLPKMTKVDDVRYQLFKRHYAPKDDNDPMAKIKGANPSSMPPCFKVLTNKMKRANYVAALWRRADRRSPVSYLPDGHGWELRDGAYHLNWFDGGQVPRSVSQLLDDEVLELDDDEDDEDQGRDIDDHGDSDDSSDDDNTI